MTAATGGLTGSPQPQHSYKVKDAQALALLLPVGPLSAQLREGSAKHQAEAREGAQPELRGSSQTSLSSEWPLRTLKYIYVAQARLNSLSYAGSWNGLQAPLANDIYFCLYKLARSYYCALAPRRLRVPSIYSHFYERYTILHSTFPGSSRKGRKE